MGLPGLWGRMGTGKGADLAGNGLYEHLIPSRTKLIVGGGDNPTPPALKAVARPGAKVTLQWSPLVSRHSD